MVIPRTRGDEDVQEAAPTDGPETDMVHVALITGPAPPTPHKEGTRMIFTLQLAPWPRLLKKSRTDWITGKTQPIETQ